VIQSLKAILASKEDRVWEASPDVCISGQYIPLSTPHPPPHTFRTRNNFYAEIVKRRGVLRKSGEHTVSLQTREYYEAISICHLIGHETEFK
jgi:hypothetical protein